MTEVKLDGVRKIHKRDIVKVNLPGERNFDIDCTITGDNIDFLVIAVTGRKITGIPIMSDYREKFNLLYECCVGGIANFTNIDVCMITDVKTVDIKSVGRYVDTISWPRYLPIVNILQHFYIGNVIYNNGVYTLDIKQPIPTVRPNIEAYDGFKSVVAPKVFDNVKVPEIVETVHAPIVEPEPIKKTIQKCSHSYPDGRNATYLEGGKRLVCSICKRHPTKSNTLTANNRDTDVYQLPKNRKGKYTDKDYEFIVSATAEEISEKYDIIYTSASALRNRIIRLSAPVTNTADGNKVDYSTIESLEELVSMTNAQIMEKYSVSKTGARSILVFATNKLELEYDNVEIKHKLSAIDLEEFSINKLKEISLKKTTEICREFKITPFNAAEIRRTVNRKIQQLTCPFNFIYTYEEILNLIENPKRDYISEKSISTTEYIMIEKRIYDNYAQIEDIWVNMSIANIIHASKMCIEELMAHYNISYELAEFIKNMSIKVKNSRNTSINIYMENKNIFLDNSITLNTMYTHLINLQKYRYIRNRINTTLKNNDTTI